MEQFIETIGGYESWQFLSLMVGSMLLGGALIKIHWAFTSVLIFGALLALSYVTNIVSTTPDLPVYAQFVPALFAIVIVIGVFRTLLKAAKKARVNDQNCNDTVQPDNEI